MSIKGRKKGSIPQKIGKMVPEYNLGGRGCLEEKRAFRGATQTLGKSWGGFGWESLNGGGIKREKSGSRIGKGGNSDLADRRRGEFLLRAKGPLEDNKALPRGGGSLDAVRMNMQPFLKRASNTL